MIQKEKIRGVGYFLMALAAGLLPFSAPDACAQALREGLALCGGPLLLSLFPFLIVSTLLIQCPAADVLGLPFCPAARLIGVRAPAAGRVLLIGSLGGFAPAASAAAGAVRSGQLTGGQLKLRKAQHIRSPVHLPHIAIDLVDGRVIGQQHIHLAGKVHSLRRKGGADDLADKRPLGIVHPRHIGGDGNIVPLCHHFFPFPPFLAFS